MLDSLRILFISRGELLLLKQRVPFCFEACSLGGVSHSERVDLERVIETMVTGAKKVARCSLSRAALAFIPCRVLTGQWT